MTTQGKMLEEAIEVAHKWHKGQFRKCGLLPYIVHPLEVMKKLHSWGVRDEEILAAAVLHDTLEDTAMQIEDFEPFGHTVYDYVLDMTCDPELKKKEYMERFKDVPIEVLLIKAADRLCNCADYEQTDPKYATIYFKKADVVWKRLQTVVQNGAWGELEKSVMSAWLEVVDYL
jgi:(p)ppGpp synthase/HD superfamily hydrolase